MSVDGGTMAYGLGGWLQRSALVLLAVGLGLLAAPPVLGAPAQDAAQDLVGYSGTAAADGLRASVLADDYILVDRPVDAGAPTAQAQLDSSGTSVGYAALPDPGELVRVAPGLAASLLGGVVVPAYPLIAASSDPGVPHAELSTVSYRLEATSSATSSEASAATGAALGEPAVGQVKGEASVTLDPDLRKLISRATASVDVVSVLGGLLRIGRVESRASASQSVGGALERSSEFKVEGASILGQSIKINDDGIVLAGQTTPLPLAGSVLADALKDAGIGLRLLPQVETEDGVVSAGLELTIDQSLPNSATPARITVVLGRTSAFATGPSTEDPDEGTEELPSDSGSVDVGSPLAPIDPGLPGLPSIPGADRGSPSPSAPAPAASIAAIEDTAVVGFYLVLVAGAVMALGSSVLFRLLAVRSPWIR